MDKDAVLIALGERGRFWAVEFDELTEAEQVFRVIWELEGDVNNGGFDQYYFNSSGDTAFLAARALRSLGAETTAEIVEKANAVFPGSSPPRDRAKRQQLLEALPDTAAEQWDVLDAEFYKYPDNLTELVFAYVTRHAGDIEGAPDLVR